MKICFRHILLFLTLLAVCASATSASTLRVAIPAAPNTLDLPSGSDQNAHNIAWHIYDSLTRINANGDVVPALAESWTISKNGREWTFHLRKGVKFHNNETFNANSVVATWERGRRDRMLWREKFDRVQYVQKVDDVTVKIGTEQPDPLLLRIIAQYWAMIPPRYYQQMGEYGFLKHPAGTGPFVLKDWKKSDSIFLEANPDYWEAGFPKVKKLEFQVILDPAARMTAVQSGDVDIAVQLDLEHARTLESVSGVKVIPYPLDQVYFIAFNNLTTGKGKPTESPLVRKAMNYAVNVQAIIDNLFDGYGRQSTGLVTAANWGYDPSIKPFGHDPQKAARLLKAAGYPDGFAIEFACPAGAYPRFEQVCQAVRDDLNAVGVVADLTMMEPEQFWDLQGKKQLPPLFGDAWSETAGEALPRLKGALDTRADYSAWSDPKIHALIRDIESTVDPEARATHYAELQRLMLEKPPFIYLYEPVGFDAANNRVRHYRPGASGHGDLKHASIQEE